MYLTLQAILAFPLRNLPSGTTTFHALDKFSNWDAEYPPHLPNWVQRRVFKEKGSQKLNNRGGSAGNWRGDTMPGSAATSLVKERRMTGRRMATTNPSPQPVAGRSRGTAGRA